MKHKVSLVVFLCLFSSTVFAADQKSSPWSFLLGLFQTVTQTVGTATGGPLGGVLGSVVSGVLGSGALSMQKQVVGDPASDDARFTKLLGKCHWGVYLSQVGEKTGLSGWLSVLLSKNQNLAQTCQVLFDIEDHLKAANPQATGFQHLKPSMIYTCTPYLVKKVLSVGVNKVVYGSENIVTEFSLTGSQAEAALLCGEMVKMAVEADVTF